MSEAYFILTFILRVLRINSITPGLLAAASCKMSSGMLKFSLENNFPGSNETNIIQCM